MNKLIFLSLLLTACTTSKPDAVVPPPEKVVHIDARILEPCEPLVGVSATEVTFEDILASTITNFEIYRDCSNKQKNSVILLKKFSNITTGEEKK